MQDFRQKFPIQRQLTKKIFWYHYFLTVLEKDIFLKKLVFSEIILNFFSFKIDNITLDSDPDPNWGKILNQGPEPNSR